MRFFQETRKYRTPAAKKEDDILWADLDEEANGKKSLSRNDRQMKRLNKWKKGRYRVVNFRN